MPVGNWRRPIAVRLGGCASAVGNRTPPPCGGLAPSDTKGRLRGTRKVTKRSRFMSLFVLWRVRADEDVRPYCSLVGRGVLDAPLEGSHFGATDR